MILCITPDPAIERTLTVPGFTAGEVFRASAATAMAGGEGFNMARAARLLGHTVRCIGFGGGYKGQLLDRLACEEGFDVHWVPIDGDNRTAIIALDPKVGTDQRLTTFYERGPQISAADWTTLQTAASAALASEGLQITAWCGSLPPAGTLQTLVKQSKAPIWIDPVGENFQDALAAKPSGIKLKAQAAAAFLRRSVTTLDEAASAARDIQAMGCPNVCITLGVSGAALVSGSEGGLAKPPLGEAVNTLNGDDAFFAGLLTSLVEGTAPTDALRRAVAVGTASTLQPIGGRFAPEDYQRLLPAVVLHKLSA